MADHTPAEEPAHNPRGTGHLAAGDLVHQVRRFMDQWKCDRHFRENLLVDPNAAVASKGILLDPEGLRVFWDDRFRADFELLAPAEASKRIGASGLIWIELQQREREYTRKVRGEVPVNPKFAKWRQKQIENCNGSFSKRHADAIPHISFAIELSKGCSVGCWFCGVSAPRLDGHYRYSSDNANSFKTILKTMTRIGGVSAGKHGILYWGTDPFDHPDYESFALDFKEEFGAFPFTTTAQGWKNLPRLRKLIRLAGQDGHSRVRLSILNLKMLNHYLTELSSSELARVSFAPVNKGSILPTAEAGRAREKRPRTWTRFDASQMPGDSISCVSGFLISLVDKSIRLMSPCPSSDRWPNGYVVHEQQTYSDAQNFDSILNGMIERNMAG